MQLTTPTIVRRGQKAAVRQLRLINAATDILVNPKPASTDCCGWFDHVVPPLAATWPGGGHAGYLNSQFRYGPRVPCLVVSPYAKRGINHTFYSHASIVKFCLRRFGLKAWNAPALQPNDKSGDMGESFDFTAAPRLAAPSALPT